MREKIGQKFLLMSEWKRRDEKLSSSPRRTRFSLSHTQQDDRLALNWNSRARKWGALRVWKFFRRLWRMMSWPVRFVSDQNLCNSRNRNWYDLKNGTLVGTSYSCWKNQSSRSTQRNRRFWNEHVRRQNNISFNLSCTTPCKSVCCSCQRSSYSQH